MASQDRVRCGREPEARPRRVTHWCHGRNAFFTVGVDRTRRHIASTPNLRGFMRRTPTRVLLSLAIVTAVTACASDPVAAPDSSRGLAANASVGDDHGHITYAVIGDFPYGAQKRAELPALVDLINADPLVERVLHVGDIKAGSSSDCSDAYLADIREQFDRFEDPFVYTPGDNEWTDCHVQFKNNGLYTPTERLAAVRTVFFPNVGRT